MYELRQNRKKCLIGIISIFVILIISNVHAKKLLGLIPIYISEISASEGVYPDNLLDEDGEQVDWIEIHNASDIPCDLTGWFLTDNRRKPLKWEFPKGSVIKGDQYLIVFASGKNRRNPELPLHTNFKINKEGEIIALIKQVNEEGLIIDEIKLPNQHPDITYGIKIENNNLHAGYFFTASPGKPNSKLRSVNQIPNVIFSKSRGKFQNAITLDLSCPDQQANIYYTLDGSIPTESDLVFKNPITIKETSMVQARAFKQGSIASNIITHTYIFGDLAKKLQHIPIVSIVTNSESLYGKSGILGMSDKSRNGKFDREWKHTKKESDFFNPIKRGRAWEKFCSVEFFNSDKKIGSNFDDQYQINCGIRLSGSDYHRLRLTPDSKPSFRLYFRSEYGQTHLPPNLKLYGTNKKIKRLSLRSGHDVSGLINSIVVHDELGRRLWQDMGHPSITGNFAHVLLNGKYLGYYNLVERIDRYSISGYDNLSYQKNSNKTEGLDIIKRRGEVNEGDNQSWNDLLNLAKIGNLSGDNKLSDIASALDLTNFIDYLILNLYAVNSDWPFNNWTAFKTKNSDSKFKFIVWDTDEAFGYPKFGLNYDHIAKQFHLISKTDNELPILFRALLNSQDTYSLVPIKAEWKIFKGKIEPSKQKLAWTKPSFDDRNWQKGPAGIGYNTKRKTKNSRDIDRLNTNLSDMKGNYVSVYLRHKFNLENNLTNKINQLMLTVSYDDAFVAYLNGIEIHRTKGLRGLDNPPRFNQKSSVSHSANGWHHTYDISKYISILKEKDNVLSIQVHNSSAKSSDLIIIPQLTAYTFSKEHAFRKLFSERVKKHFFNDGVLTHKNLLRRFSEIKETIISVDPNFDDSDDYNLSLEKEWIPKRSNILLKQLKSHGLYF